MGEENQPENDAKDQQSQRLKGIERLHEKSSAIRCKSLIRTLRDSSRNAKPSAAPTALPGFQVQSLANHKEQQGIMTTVEKIGVISGGARAANSATSVRAVAATFESGA
jgi:hypothetical protein